MKKSSSKINIFNYLDYREYLKEWYQDAKSTRRAFSLRSFSKKVGFKSPNFFTLVMEGDRNLSEDSLTKLAIGLGLNKEEHDFFRNLIFFNQAKNHEQRDFYYQKFLRSRKFSQLKPIEKDQYEYYSTWHHPVVRELVVSKYYDGTSESIAKRIFPPILPTQVEKSIQLLEKLGFIKRVGSNQWKQSSSIISTGPELASLVVLNYHQVILDLTKQILHTVPQSKRDISTLTLGVVKGRMDQIKKKIQDFRQDILKLVSMDTEPEEVAQLNIQLFSFNPTDEEVL